MTSNVKVMIFINIFFLLITIGVTIIFLGRIKSLDKSLNSERLKSEMILCEKLGLDKQIVNYKKDLDLMRIKNASLEELFKAANLKLSIQEQELTRFTQKRSQALN